MVTLLPLIFATAGMVGTVLGSPLAPRQPSTPNSQGYHDGFFYYWWSDGGSPATYTNTRGGSYSLEWETGGDLLGGKGWMPGTDTRAIEFSSMFQPNGTSYIGVFGELAEPAAEYFIIENYFGYTPLIGATKVGTVKCDGSTYTLGYYRRVGWLVPVYYQYYSVRENTRSNGTVHVACHFDAWRQAGLQLGNKLGFQILATEGYFSSGTSEVALSEAI